MLNLSKNRTVKGKTLTAENSAWARMLEKKKAAKLHSASKQEIKTPESEKPAVVNATPEASLTPEQIAAAAHLNYVTNKEIRNEFKSEGAYLAYQKAILDNKVKIATGQGVKTYPKPA